MAEEISIPIGEDGVIPLSCVGSEAKIALCGCDETGCDNLPPRIKVTLSGMAEFTERIDNLATPQPAAEIITHRVVIPTTVFTMDGAGGVYTTTLSCDVSIAGTITRRLPGYTGGQEMTGSLRKLREVTIGAESLGSGECVLGFVGLLCDGATNINDFSGFVYDAQYASLQRPLLGTHPLFGSTLGANADGYRRVGGAESTLGNPRGISIFTPPTLELRDDLIGLHQVYTWSYTSWTITIEAHDGDPICDSSPIVYATKCGDDSQQITVDLADSLVGTYSLPFFEESVWVPTDRNSSDPVDTRVWVSQECDTTTYPVYRRCGNDADSIVVDESDRPVDAVTAMHDNKRYLRTDEVSLGPAVSVAWSTESCPTGGLWQRCSDLAPGAPTLARLGGLVSIADDVDYVRHVYVRSYMDGQRRCGEVWFIYYRRVLDDGGTHPSLAQYVVPASACDEDSFYGRRCVIPGSDQPPFDPTDPFPQAITQPPGPDPMAAQLAYFNNPRCPSCGG